ncbi:hypothetical protein Tco_0693388 [Tanacetum coccineum]
MSTRSSAIRLLSPIEDPERLLNQRNRSELSLLFYLEEDDMAGQDPPQGLIPELRSMEELLQAPTDGVRDAILIDTFYNSLNQSKHDSLNSAANGNFLTKNTQEALTIIENKSKVQTSRNKPQVSSASGSSNQDAHVIALTKQVEVLLSSINQPVNSIQNGCETCGGTHPYYECQAAGGYTQDVYATSGTYNQGCNAYQPQGTRIRTRIDIIKGYNQNQAQSNVPSLEEMMYQHMRTTKARIQQMQDYNNQQVQHLKTQNTNMSNKMGQMQKILMERPQGVLPSNTVPNPREDLKVITTRSGVTLVRPSVPPPLLSSSKKLYPASTSSELPPTPVSSPVILERNLHQPPIPYPSRLNKEKLQDKADIQIHSVLQIFKKIYFNIIFAEALAHMPKFAKMVKDLLTNKEKLLELANTSLNENYSVVLLKKLPEKLGDTGRFLIPCDFYGLESCMAYSDLVLASIDASFSVWRHYLFQSYSRSDDPSQLGYRKLFAYQTV